MPTGFPRQLDNRPDRGGRYRPAAFISPTPRPPRRGLLNRSHRVLMATRSRAIHPQTSGRRLASDPAELERLEHVALFTSGFSMEAWLDLSPLLFSFWSAVTFKQLKTDR